MLFWLPLLEASFHADYAIMQDDVMRTNGTFASQHTISFSQLLKDKGEEDGTTFMLGIPTILTILLTIFIVKKVDNKYKDFYLLSIIFSLICLFMASRFFPWAIMPNILCKLQYPWRTIGFFNFFMSIVCGINLYIFVKQLIKKDSIRVAVIGIFVILCICSSTKILSQFYTKNDKADKGYENYILENRKITHMQINRDYMPLKAIKLQTTYVQERNDETCVLKGNAEIINETKENLKDEIKIKDATQNTILEFPYYYYPGYKIELKTSEETIQLKAIESEHGYLACKLEQDILEGTIKVKYVGTTITNIAYIVSAISFVIFIAYIVYENRKEEGNCKN